MRWVLSLLEIRGELSTLDQSHNTIAGRKYESQAALSQNASGSFGIKNCMGNSRLLVEATLHSPIECRRAKLLWARKCQVLSISELRKKLQLLLGEPSRFGPECVGFLRYQKLHGCSLDS
ncbi:hypothetical protein Csa_016860 [Cucumis sativus]|uniref:Uncharacterized protein n=1 Tax=Cucumis sativus TaxID=3659 RepID=A0A0A0K3X8_CUCSA|nr:hypothetical protein Csa_016860 [Cucumis sativus]